MSWGRWDWSDDWDLRNNGRRRYCLTYLRSITPYYRGDDHNDGGDLTDENVFFHRLFFCEEQFDS
jgi:hypothetical protein